MKDVVLVGLLLAVVLAVGCYTQSLEERLFPAEPEVTTDKAGKPHEARQEEKGPEGPGAPEEEPEELWWPC